MRTMTRLLPAELTLPLLLCFCARANLLIETNAWKSESPRPEIRPSFEMRADAGPSRQGSLFIQADDREGLDGHWAKTFPAKGGQHYRFRALRRGAP